MAALKVAYPDYEIPPLGYEGDDITPTQFDHTRKESLGVKLRGVETIFTDAVGELKKKGLL